MPIKFIPLTADHFPLLLQWLETPHVNAYWDPDITWDLELIKQKYSSYLDSYKLIDGVKKPIHAFVIYSDKTPIGYIQTYNAYDFPHSTKLIGLPKKLAAFDIFIGETAYLGQGLGSQILGQFFSKYLPTNFTHVFADPDAKNLAAIKCYEKAGFKILKNTPTGETWMLCKKLINKETNMLIKKKSDFIRKISPFCGELYEILTNKDSSQISLAISVDIKPTIGHYHLSFEEIYLILDGKLDLESYDPVTNIISQITLGPNELVIFKPGIHHRITRSTENNRLCVICLPCFNPPDEHKSNKI